MHYSGFCSVSAKTGEEKHTLLGFSHREAPQIIHQTGSSDGIWEYRKEATTFNGTSRNNE